MVYSIHQRKTRYFSNFHRVLGNTILLLARHPGYYSKLHKIIIETFGPYSEDVSSVTFESLKACSHLPIRPLGGPSPTSRGA